MQQLIKTVSNGHGHRMQPEILYALFSNTVKYDPAFKRIKEAFISSDFEEAAAEVILNDDPKGTQFVASPYWGETLVHLAGFLVNGNPSQIPANTTFMMDSFQSFEQATDLEPGVPYFTYVRVTQRDKDTTSCDVYVFDSAKLVIQCSGLRFHEVSNEILDRLLGKESYKPEIQRRSAEVSIPVRSETREQVARGINAPRLVGEAQVISEEAPSNTAVFDIILESVAKATGTKISELVDDMKLDELGTPFQFIVYWRCRFCMLT